MSRINFHSPSGTIEIRGSERAWAGRLCSNLLNIALDWQLDTFSKPHPLLDFIADTHYLHKTSREHLVESAETAVVVDLSFNLPDGTSIDSFHLSLNTAYQMGNDTVKFLARVHGQSEVHGFVEGHNRAWLANIIDQGLASGPLRTYDGAFTNTWADLSTMLRQRDDEPVVMSYSVCESFPNRYVANCDDTNSHIDWYDLSDEQQWILGMQGLRNSDAGCTYGLELKPDNWDHFIFHNGMNGYQLLALALQQQERMTS